VLCQPRQSSHVHAYTEFFPSYYSCAAEQCCGGLQRKASHNKKSCKFLEPFPALEKPLAKDNVHFSYFWQPYMYITNRSMCSSFNRHLIRQNHC